MVLLWLCLHHFYEIFLSFLKDLSNEKYVINLEMLVSIIHHTRADNGTFAMNVGSTNVMMLSHIVGMDNEDEVEDSEEEEDSWDDIDWDHEDTIMKLMTSWHHLPWPTDPEELLQNTFTRSGELEFQIQGKLLRQ